MSLRIALVGAPGSGKSETADALAKAYKGEALVDVVDDYVMPAIERIDMVPGFDAGYIGNMAIALERAGRDRNARDDVADLIITCGSLFENSVYTAMEFEAMQAVRSDAEKADDLRRIEATMKMLACLYMDTWKYSQVYYLQTIQAPDPSPKWAMFDRHLQTAFQTFSLTDVVPLLNEERDTRDQIIQTRVETIQSIIEGERAVARHLEGDQPEPTQAD